MGLERFRRVIKGRLDMEDLVWRFGGWLDFEYF